MPALSSSPTLAVVDDSDPLLGRVWPRCPPPRRHLRRRSFAEQNRWRTTSHGHAAQHRDRAAPPRRPHQHRRRRAISLPRPLPTGVNGFGRSGRCWNATSPTCAVSASVPNVVPATSACSTGFSPPSANIVGTLRFPPTRCSTPRTTLNAPNGCPGRLAEHVMASSSSNRPSRSHHP